MLKKYEKSCHRTKYNSLRSCFGGKSTLRQTVKPIICSNPAFAASKIAITSSKVVVYFQTLLLSTSLYVSIYVNMYIYVYIRLCNRIPMYIRIRIRKYIRIYTNRQAHSPAPPLLPISMLKITP